MESAIFGTILLLMTLVVIGIWMWAWIWAMCWAWDRWVEPHIERVVARKKGWDDDWLRQAKARRDGE